jgi:hypothetical protein
MTHGRQLDAEELEHVWTERHRTQEQRKPIDRDAARHGIALPRGEACRHAEEERRRIERIDDREEPDKREDEGTQDAAHNSPAAGNWRYFSRD